MPHAEVEFHETPNPNALKCVLSHPVAPLPGRDEDSIRSYPSPDRAHADPLALRLFSLPGIVNVLIHATWVTLGKSASADWATLKPAVRKILSERA